MTAPYLNDERLVDLLIEQATAGLGSEELAELETLISRYPNTDRTEIERTVAALTLAGEFKEEPLPARVRERVLTAESAMRGRAATSDLTERARSRTPAAAAPSRAGAQAGWWAAAAAVLIAIAGWYPRLASRPVVAAADSGRAELIASTPGLVRWEFAPPGGPAPKAASGDVVWDPVSQRGYLRLKGLDANDARQSQYQLWIFDGERDDRYPVDGGVFDIPAGRTEVVIPIVARLRVGKPALFAVTVEKPGGVVVSGRERIAVLAKAAST